MHAVIPIHKLDASPPYMGRGDGYMADYTLHCQHATPSVDKLNICAYDYYYSVNPNSGIVATVSTCIYRKYWTGVCSGRSIGKEF